MHLFLCVEASVPVHTDVLGDLYFYINFTAVVYFSCIAKDNFCICIFSSSSVDAAGILLLNC